MLLLEHVTRARLLGRSWDHSICILLPVLTIISEAGRDAGQIFQKVHPKTTKTIKCISKTLDHSILNLLVGGLPRLLSGCAVIHYYTQFNIV